MFIGLDEVPYLTQFPNDGRIIPLMNYFDGNAWHTYIQQLPGKLLDLRPVGLANGLYVAESPAAILDMEVSLLTFLFQRRPTAGAFNSFQPLANDLENSLAVLHKQFILFPYYQGRSDMTYMTVVSSEIEYALANHRSAYDLLNVFADGFLKAFGLSKNKMPGSFADVLSATKEVHLRYGFTKELSDFYASRADRFRIVRDLRNSVAHHGKEAGVLFKLPQGFGIQGASRFGRNLKNKGLWEILKPAQNDIGSCLAFLAFLSADLFGAFSDFTAALTASVTELPPETAPGFRIYARSPLAHHRIALGDYLANPWCMGDSSPST